MDIAEPLPPPAFPPARPTPFHGGFVFKPLPPFLVAPIIIPPGEPPCDPKKDPDCPQDPPGPEEPPVEVSEPPVLWLLAALMIAMLAASPRLLSRQQNRRR
ncbi:MAG: hypothetical protein AAGC77_01085 [Pseudomonadota bacterium]